MRLPCYENVSDNTDLKKAYVYLLIYLKNECIIAGSLIKFRRLKNIERPNLHLRTKNISLLFLPFLVNETDTVINLDTMSRLRCIIHLIVPYFLSLISSEGKTRPCRTCYLAAL